MLRTSTAFLLLAVAWVMLPAAGADWPAWRHDAGRTACSPEDLPDELPLLWERAYTPREPAWEEPLNQDRMPFDRTFEPVAAEGLLFVGFNDADKLVALDAATGEERWVFYTDGPVRLPAAVEAGKVYFACDDGYLYCLNARDGALVWKHRGGPSDRRILGNARLISTWPARGGPVLADGIVYYAAGIWPFMGIFIYALDANTGKEVWRNDSTGPQYQLQPHNAPSFAGVAPQGAFVVDGDKLLVPGGRSVPACFERGSGRIIHYNFAENNKTGGSFLCAQDGIFFNHHEEKLASLYDVATGERLAHAVGGYPVLAGSTWYFSGPSITAADVAAFRKDPKQATENPLFELPVDATGDLIVAGKRLYAAGKGRITAVDLSEKGEPTIAWAKAVKGDVERLLAADGRLFAVTLDGRILAFGGGNTPAAPKGSASAAAEPPADIARKALAILEQTGVHDGYALAYGNDDRLAEALAVHSNLRVVGVQPEADRVTASRQRIDATGLYGERIAVHGGDLLSFDAPPYMASLTVVDGMPPDGALDRVYRSMRPYGGKAIFLGLDKAQRRALRNAAGKFAGLKTEDAGDAVVLIREGPLEGAGTWTHLLGDVAQTGKSDDCLVRAPLGILWFGGNSNVDVLPRHGHGPTEQVIGGRLFIEGINCMSARDVYTGRVLWKRTLQHLGTDGVYFSGDAGWDPSFNQPHIPGANVRGTNFVATLDSVYVVQAGYCHVLDAATGETRTLIALPPKDPTAKKPQPPDWGFIGVYEDLLIGGADFVEYTDLLQVGREQASAWEVVDKAADRKLLVMDRNTGARKWEQEAVHGFLHNAIVAGNDTLFCLDKLPPGIEDQLERRGKPIPDGCRLLAFDIRTGETRWENRTRVFGSFLCYSEEEDILVQSTRPSRDSGPNETGRRMAAYRGKDGSLLWDREFGYGTFPLLHGTQLITESGSFDLLTGEPILRANLLTLAMEPWSWQRTYGCNYPIACENLITFRSGAAGYFDFANDGGTGNFGGFKSGCSANLVAADGVLNAPDYTRTCVCSYQNQTSLALIHMPEVEMWTFNAFQAGEERVVRVGINLGAPGDRRADDGTLWLDYPSVGGPSPDLQVSIAPQEPRWFCGHSSRLEGDGLKWVAASGAEGLASIAITLAPGAPDEQRYTVRLYFAEPEAVRAGERVFDVSLQGKPALARFDIAAEAGGPNRAVVKEFTGVNVRDVLTVALTKSDSGKGLDPVLCGIEAVAETQPTAVAQRP
jgi:outer membrane protein assembly factor BamB